VELQAPQDKGAAVSDAALWAVAQNSIRHLTEADDHFKKQRYASAFASAVLSIEEAGKANFLLATGKQAEKNSHRVNQLVFIGLLYVLTGLPKDAQWQTILKEGLQADAALSAEQQQTIAEHPEFGEWIDRLRAGELTDTQERVNAWAQAALAQHNRDGTADRWRPMYEGLFHKLRLKATYVDVGEDGEVKSGPSMIQADNAELLCFGALGLLYVTLGITLKARPGLSSRAAECLKAFPDDMTSMATVKRILQLLQVSIDRAANAAGKAT
jgi:hypothetical protein